MVIGGWRGPGWHIFDADRRYVGQARRSITSVIASHGCPVNRDDAAVCISELVTNALVHGPAGGRVLVGYCLWREGVRLVVCDGGGPDEPRVVRAGGYDAGGRGLQVVDRLAARWGSFRLPGARVVWCDLGQPLRAAPIDAWAWLRLVLSADSLAVPESPAVAVRPGTLAAAGAR